MLETVFAAALYTILLTTLAGLIVFAIYTYLIDE